MLDWARWGKPDYQLQKDYFKKHDLSRWRAFPPGHGLSDASSTSPVRCVNSNIVDSKELLSTNELSRPSIKSITNGSPVLPFGSFYTPINTLTLFLSISPPQNILNCHLSQTSLKINSTNADGFSKKQNDAAYALLKDQADILAIVEVCPQI